MKDFFAKHGKTLAIVVSIGIGIALMITAMFMLSQYEEEIRDRASSRAQYNTVLVRNTIEDGLNELVTKASSVAQEAKIYDNLNDLKTFFNIVKGEAGIYNGVTNQDYDMAKLRFFNDGLLYESYGDEVSLLSDDPSIKYYQENCEKAVYAGTYFDSERNMAMISFYAPVEGSELIDGVEIIYTRKRLELFFSEEYTSENAEFSVLTNMAGIIIVGDDSKSDALPAEENVYIGSLKSVLRDMVGEKDPLDQLENFFINRIDGTIKCEVDQDGYIISVGSSDKLNDLFVVELYKVDKLCESGLTFVNSVIAILILFVIIAIGVIVYLIIHNQQIQRKLYNVDTTDPILGCLNRVGYERSATDIITRNVNSYFAVIVMEIRHFNYINEKHGESESNNVLRYIRYAAEKYCIQEETYGYNENGEFLILAHAKDRQELIDRLKVFSFVISKYKGSNQIDVLLKYGIYEIDEGEKTPLSKMIDYAKEANNSVTQASAENALMQFNFYDIELRKNRTINEDMELRMESALKAGEFQVFFQPKYNLHLDKQDGCEALVRWYDVATGIYNPPALFMALFESNGFITKLDRYVFERVCEYISYSIAHGRPVFPVSVNVSRITAIQPGFVEFYSKIKKKYGISDNLLMIEFTESFAYENYEILYKIVEGLHNAGFKCSIDDFGCGYSSYLILKSLPMDEIKLDRIFMEKGLNDERDNTIYRSVVSLGKDLSMKVTQEGVETKDGVDYIRKMGCDVLQGYYYSKPLAMSDYIKFTQSSREHNIK